MVGNRNAYRSLDAHLIDHTEGRFKHSGEDGHDICDDIALQSNDDDDDNNNNNKKRG